MPETDPYRTLRAQLDECISRSQEALDRSTRLLAIRPDPWPSPPEVIRQRFGARAWRSR